MKSNPFSTRFLVDGQLPWLYPCDQSPQSLYRRLVQQHDRRAAIVGPHGTGKSTLLAELVPLLGQVVYYRNAAGQVKVPAIDGSVIWVALRRSSGTLDVARSHWQPKRTLVVDGFEQLNRLARLNLLWATHRLGMGLVVTSHRKCLLPTLLTTGTNAEQVQALVHHACQAAAADYAEVLAQLAGKRVFPDSPSARCEQIAAGQRVIATVFGENQGDVRETFMQLYDRYESNRSLPVPVRQFRLSGRNVE